MLIKSSSRLLFNDVRRSDSRRHTDNNLSMSAILYAGSDIS